MIPLSGSGNGYIQFKDGKETMKMSWAHKKETCPDFFQALWDGLTFNSQETFSTQHKNSHSKWDSFEEEKRQTSDGFNWISSFKQTNAVDKLVWHHFKRNKQNFTFQAVQKRVASFGLTKIDAFFVLVCEKWVRMEIMK